VEWIRDRKNEIRDLVLVRMALTGASVRACVPLSIDKAWGEWEAHFLSTYFNTPWDGFSSYPGRILQPETAPLPLP